jgi:hypothetical protein
MRRISTCGRWAGWSRRHWPTPCGWGHRRRRGGLSLQLVALHLGALGVVQPLLVSGLLFALILRQRTRRYTSHREIGWAVLVTLCLAGFLLLAGTAHQPVSNEPADRIPAAAAVIGVVLAIGCVLLGRRQSPGSRSAALLGVAVGTIYAATAALLKALTGIALHGPVALFTSWQLYAVQWRGPADCCSTNSPSRPARWGPAYPPSPPWTLC